MVEASLGLGLLMVLALFLLKSSMNATASQQWTIVQAMTDAYMTRESALAKRLPMDAITAGDSAWPVSPQTAVTTEEIARLPGGVPYTLQVTRTRIPDPNNLASASGGGDETSNPAHMEAWKLQSTISYDVGGREYVKTRTVMRVR